MTDPIGIYMSASSSPASTYPAMDPKWSLQHRIHEDGKVDEGAAARNVWNECIEGLRFEFGEDYLEKLGGLEQVARILAAVVAPAGAAAWANAARRIETNEFGYGTFSEEQVRLFKQHEENCAFILRDQADNLDGVRLTAGVTA